MKTHCMLFLAVLLSLWAGHLRAAEAEPSGLDSTATSVKKNLKAGEEIPKEPVKGGGTPVKIQSATISLQTTVTGNQEQPKVLYILPWQSPQTGDVDFESIENQQKSVFEHVERDELKRALNTQTETEKVNP